MATNDAWAWRQIFIALAKGEDDRKEIETASGKIPALEVTIPEIKRIAGAHADLGFSFGVYQELMEGGYARIDPPLREAPVVRITRDPKAYEAGKAAQRLGDRKVTSPLRRGTVPIRRRGWF